LATKEEQALHDALINTYTYNLQFLSQYDNELYQRITMLSDAINENLYKERYHLEFIKENNEFDILDTSNQEYIYKRDGKKWNNDAVKSSNFDHENTINLLNPIVYDNNITDLSQEEMDTMNLTKIQVMSEIQNYKNIRNEKINNKAKKVKEINKFIFIGTLAARHIPRTIKKLNTVNHFVCEENLEIFRLSLFTCDYSILARDGKSVIFSIMENENIFIEKFNEFFNNFIEENTFYKYFSTNYNISNYFDRILNIVLERDPFIFNYKLILNNIVKKSCENFNKYNTLVFNEKSKDIFKHDILFLGAGPSLGENIQWVKKHQDKYIIVAMGATLKRLTAHGIKPDIITTLDPQEDIVKNQFINISKEDLDKCIKIASINTPLKVFDMFDSNPSSVYTYEMLRSFIKDNTAIDGISIGEVTFKILLLLNAKNIYLLGLDLALNQKTGLTHDDETIKSEINFKINNDKSHNESVLNKSFSLREDTVVVQGNLHPKVTTTRLFNLSIMGYNRAILADKKPNQNIYNLSGHGAYIQETIPTKIENVIFQNESINKKELLTELKLLLNKTSIKELDNNSKNMIDLEINRIDSILEILNDIKGKRIKRYSQLKEEMKTIQKQIYYTDTKNSYLLEIYLNFSFVINRYIDFVFNDRSLKNDTKDLKDIKYIWCQHLDYIINQYKNYIKTLVD